MQELISSDKIQEKVKELAYALDDDNIKDPLLIGVLTGAFFFLADLARAMSSTVEIGFIYAKSYEGKESTGVITVHGPTVPIHDRNVILVEDIVDTGLTITTLIGEKVMRDPKSIEVCTLLDKPSRRQYPINVKYAGFTIEDKFVVGYGLDHNGKYRDLAGIYVLEDSDV